jgi:hypothetical protein
MSSVVLLPRTVREQLQFTLSPLPSTMLVVGAKALLKREKEN